MEESPTTTTESLISSEMKETEKKIRDKLFERFGKVAKISTDGNVTIENATDYSDTQVQTNMRFNCGSVSEIVQKVVGGERYIIQVNGNEPSITFKGEEIASGHASAVHAFVVDGNELVWDPIANEWGTKKKEEYLANLLTRNTIGNPTVTTFS